MEKQPCPSCRTHDIWYWGWYERKEGKIPYGDGETASGPIPIRRFFCPKCKSTFSWRPRFLVFGRPYAAVAYQQALAEWALGRVSAMSESQRDWYQLDVASLKAFFQMLDRGQKELIKRLYEGLQNLFPVSYRKKCNQMQLPKASASGRDEEKRALWQLTRTLAKVLSGREKQPRFSCHYIFIALAQHPCGARYSLESA